MPSPACHDANFERGGQQCSTLLGLRPVHRSLAKVEAPAFRSVRVWSPALQAARHRFPARRGFRNRPDTAAKNSNLRSFMKVRPQGSPMASNRKGFYFPSSQVSSFTVP